MPHSPVSLYWAWTLPQLGSRSAPVGLAPVSASWEGVDLGLLLHTLSDKLLTMTGHDLPPEQEYTPLQ